MNNKETIFSRYRFVIEPAIGVWILRTIDIPLLQVAFSNCSLPGSYSIPGISVWNGSQIVWALCDWNASFGVVTPPFPTYTQIIGYLTGPTRIPGPCDGGGGGGGINIYNTSSSLTGDRVVNQAGHNLSFEVTAGKTWTVEQTGINPYFQASNAGTAVQNPSLVEIRCDSTVQLDSDDTIISVGPQPTGGLKLVGIQSGSQPNQLMYDPVSKQVTYAIPATPTPVNIYNTDGTLTGIRTVSMNGQVLIFDGTGDDFIQINNIQELDVQATNNISIETPQLLLVPQLPLSNVDDQLMVQQVGTGQIVRRDASTIIQPMTPTVIGGAYGTQSTQTENHIGYENQVPVGSRSNVVGAYLPSTLTLDESNLITSYQNLSTANNTYSHSNIMISGDSTEILNSTRSHLIVHELQAGGTDMETCLYYGNMRNVTPSNLSTCITNDLFNNAIVMAKESAYLGSNRNNVVLGNGEFHIDFGCPKWFYHDLSGGTGPNMLYYDPSNGNITYDAIPSTPPVNIYNTSGTLTSARTLGLNSFAFTVNGIGTYSINNQGTLNLGTSNTGTINLGRNTQTMNILDTNISTNNIPTSTPTTFSQYGFLMMGPSSRDWSYVSSNTYTRAMFSFGTNPNTGTLPALSTGTIPNWVTTNPTNHTGYHLDVGSVDTAAGLFFVPATTQYSIIFKIELKNSLAPGRYTLQLYNSTLGQVVSSSTCDSSTINQFTTCTLVDNVILSNSPISFYTFRVANLDVAGVTSYQNAVMCVTRI